MDEKSDGEKTRGSLGRRRKCPEAPSGPQWFQWYIKMHQIIHLHTIIHLLHYISHKSVKMHQRIHLIFLIYLSIIDLQNC